MDPADAVADDAGRPAPLVVVDARPMRCKGCHYVLDHLPSPRCPECGRPFDPADPATYAARPPFVWWRYWLPGVALAAGAGAALYALLAAVVGHGVATTLLVPLCAGTLLGYGVRGPTAARLVLAVLGAGVIVSGLAMAGHAGLTDGRRAVPPAFLAGLVVGVFFGTILFALALVPILIGAVAGDRLRARLKRSGWDQGPYLP